MMMMKNDDDVVVVVVADVVNILPLNLFRDLLKITSKINRCIFFQIVYRFSCHN